MIIDAHTHIHPEPEWSGESNDALLENLISSINNIKIYKAVILPIYPQISNEFIRDACKKYPDKLIGFASVDPSDEKKAIKTLEKCVSKYHLKGLKLHPRIQKINLSGKKIVRVVKRAAALNIPLLFDCFPQWDANFVINKTFPERIGELAQEVPEAKIIMAHAGGYKLWDAFFIARANSNIYLDFSFSISYFKGSSIEQDLGFILKKLGAKRCIYGSDYPEVSMPESLKDAREMVEKINLSSEEKDYFFGKTLLSILPIK